MNRLKIDRYVYHSPCGTLHLGSFRDSLCMCDWEQSPKYERNRKRIERYTGAIIQPGRSEIISAAKTQLDEYFGGNRLSFSIPLLLSGTPFQKEVWENLLQIAPGETLSYSRLADKIGQAHSVRVVANAIASNALSIFVPCHRVIGSNHSLTGFAGGLTAKAFLLQLESR